MGKKFIEVKGRIIWGLVFMALLFLELIGNKIREL